MSPVAAKFNTYASARAETVISWFMSCCMTSFATVLKQGVCVCVSPLYGRMHASGDILGKGLHGCLQPTGAAVYSDAGLTSKAGTSLQTEYD